MRYEPFIVVGPGRCGTSYVAKRLIDAGVFMGFEFLPADENNPDGHWEDLDFVRLNEGRLRGNLTPEDWAARIRANQDIREARQQPWGWKDPRNAEFIADLVKLFPQALYVWCRRDAAAIERSLVKCYGLSLVDAVGLRIRRETALDRHLPRPYLEHWIDRG